MPAVVQASDARRLVVLYAGTMFLSAATLFLVQPMFARMVLPTLGGTPAVWNTCVLFFQVMLLLARAMLVSRLVISRAASLGDCAPAKASPRSLPAWCGR